MQFGYYLKKERKKKKEIRRHQAMKANNILQWTQVASCLCDGCSWIVLMDPEENTTIIKAVAFWSILGEHRVLFV